MATDIALARSFDETPQVIMQLPWPEAFMVASMIRSQMMYAPLLLRLMEAKYGCEDEVVYAPDHQLEVLKNEAEEYLKSLSAKSASEILGQNLIAEVTVGSVRAFLDKLLGVVNEGIADKKGLFALTG